MRSYRKDWWVLVPAIFWLLLVLSCNAPQVIQGRTFSDAPAEIYLVNGMAETLSVLNPETLAFHHNVMITGSAPNGIYYYQDRLFVINSSSNDISIFSESTFEPSGQIELGDSHNPWTLIPDNQGRGWIPHYYSGTLSVLDLNRLELSDQELELGEGPEGGCFLNGRIFVCNSGRFDLSSGDFQECSISIINTETMEVTQTIPLEDNSNPQSALAIPELNQVHVYLTGVQGDDDGQILVLDVPVSGADDISPPAPEDYFFIGGSPSIAGSAVDQNSGIVYLSGVGGILSYGYSGGDPVAIIHDSSDYLYTDELNPTVLFGGVAVYGDYLFVTHYEYAVPVSKVVVLLSGDSGEYTLYKELTADDGVQIPLLVEE